MRASRTKPAILGHFLFLQFTPLKRHVEIFLPPPPPPKPSPYNVGEVGREHKQATKVVKDFLLKRRSNFHISHGNVNKCPKV